MQTRAVQTNYPIHGDMIHSHAKLFVLIIAFTITLLLPHSSFSVEPGTDFMIDLWKYRTGEANTGLITGGPSQNSSESPPAITANVTGTIDCRQALPLHANDIIEVQLLDFSSRSSAAVISYRQILSARDLPVLFKLTYDPARINPADHYTVQARIMRNGEPAYSNTTPAFVLTHGYGGNVRVLVAEAGGKRAVRADDNSMEYPSPADSRAYIGTYTRKFTNGGCMTEETLRVLGNHTMELCAKCDTVSVKQLGVWSMENKLLAVTITHKNGEPVSPKRVVFERTGTGLAAVEYDTAAQGRKYPFTRTAGEH
jgi:putative lipoprotein